MTAVTDQGVKNHTDSEATILAGTNPDFGTQVIILSNWGEIAFD